MQMVDQEKVGTLILGYYRTGTHFLKDVIVDRHPENIRVFDEICNDNTLTELKRLTDSRAYNICILNNTIPKFLLASRPDLLQKWHVIHLSRNNKVQHFISHWFWMRNTHNERLQDSGQFKHHGTKYSSYKNSIIERTIYDINLIVVWLQEQLINYVIPSDATLDYHDLPKYATDNIQWQPNQYESLQLQDLFENYKEIENLLSNFKI